MVWSQLEVTHAHVAYACIGVFSCVFSLVSLFFKEKLYLGESSVAVLFGLIVGPHCLDWFDPTEWGNSDSITLEISRVVLCLQIFAVAVELPKKYMLKHWLSVTMLLVPVMTVGWLVVALFVWILIPGLNFSESLLVAACVTATDPILAQSVVSGKFAQRVPGHLRNLLSAESGCNDGMAFPFIFLSLNLIFYEHHAGEVTKDWICVTLLWECLFGCILGSVIGYTGRRAIRFAEEKKLIDRESFLAFYVFLSLMCAGFGSILGVDDLLTSFAAGTAFSWDGWFATSTEESNISTIIDLVLNLAYFVYFGSIIPWDQFNEAAIGMSVWRPVLLAIAVIFLRRIPAVLSFKPFIPDIKSWREAMFVGHFGPIGVGAIFAAILARSQLEAHVTGEETPLKEIPPQGSEYWQLMAVIWPLVCFLVLTSIIVHGSSVAVFTLGRHLNTITLTKSFTVHTTNGNGLTSKWMDRLPGLESEGRSFSLRRVDTMASDAKSLGKSDTIETSGVRAKPAGGMKRRDRKTKKKRGLRHRGNGDEKKNSLELEREIRQREAQAAAFALSKDEESDLGATSFTSLEDPNSLDNQQQPSLNSADAGQQAPQRQVPHSSITPRPTFMDEKIPFPRSQEPNTSESSSKKSEEILPADDAHMAYQEGSRLILENNKGEVVNEAEFVPDEHGTIDHTELSRTSTNRTLDSLKRILTPTKLRRSTLVDTDTSKKFYAYKYGNHLVIETDKGEILRRYQINQHESPTSESPTETKHRSNSMVAKALSMVKLGKSSTSKSAASGQRPHSESSGSSLASKQNIKNKMLARQLTPLPIVSSFLDEEDEEDDEEEENDDDEYSGEDSGSMSSEEEDSSVDDGEEEAETEVERARRLTALGVSTAPRHLDDEED
ncbi:unnamed protein product [Kluyveromyces dobzhanskii CBS 2104]|uniref:WGS project CCBQ000000000 data, contig 00102 n=1 Tax=Kluyveromyces dobzhanskii CBS 2104 TaxID=1427455 RepID=A0A0A8L6W4_9SACH|nr:unnamed protein product [Kluyveromyces dobzhanskii CBS 2104]